MAACPHCHATGECAHCGIGGSCAWCLGTREWPPTDVTSIIKAEALIALAEGTETVRCLTCAWRRENASGPEEGFAAMEAECPTCRGTGRMSAGAALRAERF